MRALLDVSFLVALAWENHQFHPAARHWMEKHQSRGWATCAITQLGFIRLSSQPTVFGELAKTPEEARVLLGNYEADKNHLFLAELPSATDCQEFAKIVGSRKVTDAYLIHVAHFHRCRFVTFDQKLASFSTSKNFVEIVQPSVPGG